MDRAGHQGSPIIDGSNTRSAPQSGQELCANLEIAIFPPLHDRVALRHATAEIVLYSTRANRRVYNHAARWPKPKIFFLSKRNKQQTKSDYSTVPHTGRPVHTAMHIAGRANAIA